jgi:hypothetical protein
VVSQWRSAVTSGYATVKPSVYTVRRPVQRIEGLPSLASLLSLSISRGFVAISPSGGSDGSAGSLPASYKRTSLAMDTTPAAAHFYPPAHCPRSARRGHSKSHVHATDHRQSPARRRLPRLPGGDSPTRYVKAEVVHHLYTAVTDTPRKIYVLDPSEDPAGEESSYYS